MLIKKLNSAKIISPIFLILFSPSFIFSQNVDSSLNAYDQSQAKYIFNEEMLETYPLRQTVDFLKLLPGVLEYQGSFHINGSRLDEIDFTLNNLSIRDQISGQQLFSVPKQALKSIGSYSFSNPSELVNYGSGSVDYELKSGGNNFDFSGDYSTDNIGLNSSNSFYDGKYRLSTFWYGFNESNLSASGPILRNKLSFFTNFNYQYFRDRNPQLYPGSDDLKLYDENLQIEKTLSLPEGIVYGNSQQSYNMLGKFNYNEKNFRAELVGIFEYIKSDAPRDHVIEYFNRRLGIISNNTSYLSISVEHELSDNFWYSAAGSYSVKESETYDQYLKSNYWGYGDSLANAQAGIIWERSEVEKFVIYNQGFTPDETRYIPLSDYRMNGFRFIRENSIPVNFSKSYQSAYNLEADFNYMMNDNNILKFGCSITQLLYREWNTVEPQEDFIRLLKRNYGFSSLDEHEAKKIILRNSGINNIGYNLLGEESNNGLNNAPQPLITSIFLTDTYTKNKLLVNFGVEFFRFEMDNFLLHDRGLAFSSFDEINSLPLENGFTKSPVHTNINPKFYFRYQLTSYNSLSIQYTKSSSIPNLTRMYKSPYMFFDYVLSNPTSYLLKEYYDNDLKPAETTDLAITYRHFWNLFNFESVLFYKSIENQTQPKKITNSEEEKGYYSFFTMSSDASSNIYGLSISAQLKRIKGFSFISNVSLQNTEGTNWNFAYSSVNYSEVFVRYLDAPLDYQYTFYAMTIIDYIFNDQFSSMLDNLKLSLMLNYTSGHPHSISNGTIVGGNYPQPVEFKDVNAYVTPSNFQINFRIDKSFPLSSNLELNAYFYAINLFNNNNVKDVFLGTGTAVDDGFEVSDELLERYGENYRIIYDLANIHYNPNSGQQIMYGEPRQIIFGIKLNI